jgi:chromosomal replication initiator protein
LEYNIIVENASGNSAPYVVNIPGSNSIKTEPQQMGVPLNLNPGIKNPFIIPGLKKINIDSNLNPNFTFDSFIEGDCNRLARSAGMAVAQKPGGTSFNPLMIFSETGLGKTHLVHAIGNLIKQTSKNKIVLYVPVEKFINQFFDAIKNNSNQDFLNFYQQLDVLIVDDVQFLENKHKTQEIFFTIFNHLHQQGKQIILTSDRAPKDLKGMDERLLSRFKWGLSADLQAPDFETRLAILEHMMYKDGITLHHEVVEYVAHNINTNIRELQGALISLLAQASLNKKDVNLDLAKSILKNFVKNNSREISIEYIQKLVCDYFSIPVEQVKSKTRKREIVQARQISMYYAKDLTKSSLKTIGMHFGGRDHSTVIHACQTVNDLMETDKKFKADIEEIAKRIKMNLI